MGSLVKIDDNNFVIKVKTAETTSWTGVFRHFRFSWGLKSVRYSDTERDLFLKCYGPENDLWNIDASVTLDFISTNGRKQSTQPVNINFNRSNPVYIYEPNQYLQLQMLFHTDALYPNLEVRVKINSITGIGQDFDVDFEKEDHQLSDVAFIVEEKKLYCNKAVLATFSPVFRAMFFSGFKESADKEVVINDVKHEEFKQFLQVIYEPYPYVDDDEIESLLILADRYDVQVVKEKCQKYLNSEECGFTIAKKLILAETYNLPSLHHKSIHSINTKEKLTEVCENTAQFGPMTLKAIIKKTKDLYN